MTRPTFYAHFPTKDDVLIEMQRISAAHVADTMTAKLAEAATLEIRDLGTVEGDAGFLMLTGHRVPTWGAAPLAPEIATKRVREEARAWRLVGVVLLACALLVLLSRLL